MTNPFILALKSNSDQFLSELSTQELGALAEACVAKLEKNAKMGDKDAPSLLQSLYRTVANVEI